MKNLKTLLNQRHCDIGFLVFSSAVDELLPGVQVSHSFFIVLWCLFPKDFEKIAFVQLQRLPSCSKGQEDEETLEKGI